jgi:hypothetical protein
MNTISAFAMGTANRDKESMVFDWEKAARLIKERGASNAPLSREHSESDSSG